MLTESQIEMINQGLEDIESGNLISQEELDKEDRDWLEKFQSCYIR